jgi:hypothetical protein
VRTAIFAGRARPSGPKLSVLFRRSYAFSFKRCADRLGSKSSSPSGIASSTHFLPLIMSRPLSRDAASTADSIAGHRARRPGPVQSRPGSLWRRPQSATLGSLCPGQSQTKPMALMVVGATACFKSQTAPPPSPPIPPSSISAGWSGSSSSG